MSSISITYKYNTRNSFSSVNADFSPDYKFKLGLENVPSNVNNFYYHLLPELRKGHVHLFFFFTLEVPLVKTIFSSAFFNSPETC